MTLDQLTVGTTARVERVNWTLIAEDEAKRLQALGVDADAELRVAHRGVFLGRDPLAVQIGAMTIALRRSHARAIELCPA